MASDDYLHTGACVAKGHPLCTGTQWFGFYVPDEKIYALNYISQRPNMKHLYGGVLVRMA